MSWVFVVCTSLVIFTCFLGYSCGLFIKQADDHYQPFATQQAIFEQSDCSCLLLSVHFLSFDIWHLYQLGTILKPKNVSDSIFSLWKRAFRIIANIQHTPFHLISASDLAYSLNLLELPFLTSESGYRIFHGLSPKYFSDSFHVSVKTNFNLRDISNSTQIILLCQTA